VAEVRRSLEQTRHSAGTNGTIWSSDRILGQSPRTQARQQRNLVQPRLSLGNLERFEEAVASWDKTLELQPDNTEAWYNRAVALKKIKRFTEAIASYDKIIALKPDDPNLTIKKLAFTS